MFSLTRLLVEVFSPLNISILLLITALFFLLLRKRRIGVACLCVAICVQLLCGYGVVVKKEIGKREQLFPALTGQRLAALQEQHIRYIVVLGSGHIADNRLPETSQIGCDSLYRLTEGMRLFNLLPDAKLVISGGIAYDPVPNADLVKRVAISLGIPSERVITENRPRDTVQEARYLEPLLGKELFILVTSALHMPRAIDIFKGFGMQPIAAPTDYIQKQHAIETPMVIFPSATNFDLSRRIIYEWIGTIWSKIKTSIKNSQ